MPNSADEVISRILASTDWDSYHEQLAYSLRRPDCPVHDGNALCQYWKHWLAKGVQIFGSLEEVLEGVEFPPKLSARDLTEIRELVEVYSKNQGALVAG